SLGVLLVKDILKTGIKKYLIEKSIVIRFIRYIANSIKSGFRSLTNMDLKDKNTSKITKIMALNLLSMSIFCSFWFFGIIAALVYSIVIFIFVKKKYAKINSDYNKLLKITNEIANGNLEVNTSEDMGMFNSLKNEISHIQKGFKNAVKEEVKSQKMKTELISNVSHDLKTPLTSIITYVDLLKDENLSEDKKEQYLEVLDRKSQRLKELIEDLFEVSKATSGDINLNVIDVDVVSLMKQTLLELDDKIVESNLIVKKNLPEHKVILQLDSQRMFRVFENLIINITKYSMRNSRVYIDILDNEEDVVISFRNIAAEEINYDINEITDRFVRGDKSRNTEGSGLGLAIAKSFVELHGGTLKVSTDGDLFKVVITLNK
ncbi:MAG: sensor histidine kinase, partial [Peptostreptococcaceae bacterium]